MKEYLEGTRLYGDDFSFEQIKNWYEEEAEGYADLGSKNRETYRYEYHQLNQVHGYNKLKETCFENVLGFGSAWGYEFDPIAERIRNLTIVEPSESLVNRRIGDLIPMYVKPGIDGKLPFTDRSFDLITCFGTLHHIPNVSFVIGELIRVLSTDGYLLIREPIISMGDWRMPRRGLTRNERGIPVRFFDREFSKYPLEIVSKEYCFTVTPQIQRTVGSLFRNPIHTYKTYIVLDKYISRKLKNNVRYHATRKINKISPQSIFYVIKKL
ncbi:MAG: class I SAM-dependent methyltransferase [Bacteroidetes bacterium]|nr:MAG: class I SAM-dependent methyltransferase [Bacteroidota bacterium]